MLKSFGLTNFKAFKKTEQIQVKKITVIVGKNSCGKSSILQSLLLLKQTLESNSSSPLTLDGRYLRCSNLKDISFGLPPLNIANIGYDFILENKNIESEICLHFKNKKTGDIYKGSIDTLTVKNTGKSDAERNVFIDFNNISPDIIEARINKLLFDKDNIQKIDSFELQYSKFVPEYFDMRITEEKSHLRVPTGIVIPNFNTLGFSELINVLKSIKYLSPVRAYPERAYVHYSQEAVELNENGSNAAHIMWSKRKQKVSWKGQKIPLAEAINKSFKCLGLSQSITPEHEGDLLYKVGVEESISKKEVYLTDVGFGYSQILPVILTGLLLSPINIGLIEQPEIHLHPSSAANLADLFLAFTEDNRRFIIETHSPEFINRLRLRVIQNPSLKDSINIIFVESHNENGSSIKQFEIDENGMFPDWPDGFLDESEKLAQAILQARLAKIK